MQKHDLNGKWKLLLLKDEKVKRDKIVIRQMTDFYSADAKVYDAAVPGNFELDLLRAGDINEPFFGMNTLDMQVFEDCHVYYFRSFDYSPVESHTPHLVFEGLDTIAEVWLNGELAAETDNMLIAHRIKADRLKAGYNEIIVHFKPVCIEARAGSVSPGHYAGKYNYDSLRIRKAPHMFGWDIMPRIVSAGIWKPVYIEEKPEEYIGDVYIMTREENGEGGDATLSFYYNTHINSGSLKDYTIKVSGTCQDSSFIFESRLWFTAGKHNITVKNARLWWPRGRGTPNMYDVSVSMYKGDTLIDSKELRLGIKTVRLDRTGVIDIYGEGRFQIEINKEKVFILGTNWVPVDAFHSRDKERIPEIVNMITDIGCNAVRCWGGNVYEDKFFYDFCDENGIIVWQDFALACAVYPQDDDMFRKMREEAVSAVKSLRQHPSICIWSGDNECDLIMRRDIGDRNPNINELTRKVFKSVLDYEDPVRPYLPSSPFYDEDGYRLGRAYLTENHLWGPRDYFKSKFYTGTPCVFVSEIGYHGCPSVESIKKFISSEKLWPWQNNPEWLVHSASPEIESGPYTYRIELMANQIRELFGTIPDNIEEFALASQISQAEAKKFFIEFFRLGKWNKTGIIWWNLIDGWPQFSDAVVDYYFGKKLAYYYIKRAQSQFSIAIDEPTDWNFKLCAINDLKKPVAFSYQVNCLSNDNELIASGDSIIPADSVMSLIKIPYSQSDKKFYLIKWSSDLGEGINHYLAGNPPFDLKQYMEWISKAGFYSEYLNQI